MIASVFLPIKTGQTEQPAQVTVVRAPFSITIQATGEIHSSSSTIIGCPTVSGMWQYTIATLVPEGSVVKQGDLLVSFDPKSINENLLVRRSELETARKELEGLRITEAEQFDALTLSLSQAAVTREKARNKAALSDDHVSLNEIKKNKLDYELATLNEQLAHNRVETQKSQMAQRIRFSENRVLSLEKSVSEQMEALEKMTIFAPTEGLVVYGTDWEGNKIKVGDTVWFGQIILEIPNLTNMEMRAVVAEKDAGQVHQDQKTEIRLDANPDRLFHGKLTSLGRIFREKSRDQPVIVFDVTVSILDPDDQILRPGMAAKADILVSTDQDVLQIPVRTLIYTSEGPCVLKNSLLGSTTLVPIQPGRLSAETIEVLSGLEAGDQIVLPATQHDETAQSRHTNRSTAPNSTMTIRIQGSDS